MRTEIKAQFKQATVKNGVAVLQMEILSSAKGAFDVIRLSGKTVQLTVEDEQEEIDFGPEYEAEPIPFEEPIERPANVDCETGEIYDPIEDEGFMLPDGSNKEESDE